jgi:DNA polymerase
VKTVRVDGTFEGWRRAARDLVARGVPPEEVTFTDEDQLGLVSLLPGVAAEATAPYAAMTRTPPRVPAEFLAVARRVACHRAPSRWDHLYRALWRVVNEGARVLTDPGDEDVLALARMAESVRHDVHRMHALVRFRRVASDEALERYVAFHRPEHRTLALAAPFFARRFAAMRWSILTPDAAAHWDGRALTYGPGVARDAGVTDDAEVLWRTYYATTFNPARVNPRLVRAHLPQRHWDTIPEGRDIAALVRSSERQVAQMTTTLRSASAALVPATDSLVELAAAASRCDACSLCHAATQTVFGEGPRDARVVLVGEQPGDEEDRVGTPFVGPAGKVLDAALATAGVDRQSLYVTNAVKHFKHELRGKRRIHQRPAAEDVKACSGWLEAELRAIRPAVIVALGSTAAQALLGARFPLRSERGRVHAHPLARAVLATWHPSAVLRAPEAGVARRMRTELESDLARAAGIRDALREARPDTTPSDAAPSGRAE